MSVEILTELHGRRCGLSRAGSIVLNKTDGSQELIGSSALKLITSAQLLALNATPITVVPAAPAGIAYILTKAAIRKPAGTAYAGIAAGEDLVFKYTNASGAQCSSVIETTGFLDQTTEQIRMVGMPGSTGTTAGDYAPVPAAAIVLHLLSGEITTGNSPLHVRVWIDEIDTAFVAT